MSFVIVGKRNSFMMKNGKFGQSWDAEKFKKIRLFDSYREAYEVADGKGYECMRWSEFLDRISAARVKTKKGIESNRKRMRQSAKWREVPSLTWVLKKHNENLDVMYFDWFEPTRMLISECGSILAVEGRIPEVPCIYTYEEPEVDYLSVIYTLEEQSK